MLIEIRMAGFINKGAELMLYATLEKMSEAYPDADFVMAPTTYKGAAPFDKRARLGFLQKAWLWGYGFQWGDLAAFTPRKFREMYGVILDREIDIVMDAAGFAYSDLWGPKSTKELARSCKRWHKRGTRLILLPQALGPFKKGKISEYIKNIAQTADLIFPRDSISYEHLTEVVGENPNIRMAPDFTNLIEGILPDNFDAQSYRFCLVPNFRMIEKTPKDQSEAYLPFMIKCARYLIKKQSGPFLLIHEGDNDLMIARKVSEGSGGNIPIVRESHPLKIKGILGACEGTLGSRFHGLASALSQGVPSLATGWSHKYKMLFRDYGFDEGLIDVMSTDAQIYEKIDLLTEHESRKRLQAKILKKANELKKQSEEMWNSVFKILKS
ncbi:MAG: polysaccharide pyruvyl transferase family protein [Desulfobacteraceae bacterium]|nr:MAG: polysaccharide pyruvyl transferase family protein [Desulfobacteraceae bacterium]